MVLDVGVETAVVDVVSVVLGVVADGSLPAHATINAAAGIDRNRLFMTSFSFSRFREMGAFRAPRLGETCRGAFGASVAPLLLRYGDAEEPSWFIGRVPFIEPALLPSLTEPTPLPAGAVGFVHRTSRRARSSSRRG